MNWLETKTRLIRILSEDSIGSTGLTLNLYAQFGEHFLNCAVVCEITIVLIKLLGSPRTVLCQCLVGKFREQIA
jgi:hypothetical protein